MIIGCTSCNKKFEINSNLIPDSGRLLECSNCNNQWFFKKEKSIQETTVVEDKKKIKQILKLLNQKKEKL